MGNMFALRIDVIKLINKFNILEKYYSVSKRNHRFPLKVSKNIIML